MSSAPLPAIEVDGVRMSYREAGEGIPVLLVHGNFGSSRWFVEQLDSPPSGYRLIAPNLPNFAGSGRMPGEISIERYAGYLAAFCDRLGLERLDLLGHSLGGAVAQAFALAQPERIGKLILVASAAPGGHETPAEHYPVLEGLAGNREGMALALAATMPARRPPYFAGIVDDALELADHAVTGNVRALAAIDLRARTTNYRSPVLVVRGELDPPHLITEEIARRTAAAYTDSRLELWSGVGHSPQIEAPRRFNELLARFLRGEAGGQP